MHCDSRLGPFEYQWHSTPALWCAVRPGYDGAPDARCQMGFGKTKEEAAAALIEAEQLHSDYQDYLAEKGRIGEPGKLDI